VHTAHVLLEETVMAISICYLYMFAVKGVVVSFILKYLLIASILF
jgi:hypothetical protein